MSFCIECDGVTAFVQPAEFAPGESTADRSLTRVNDAFSFTVVPTDFAAEPAKSSDADDGVNDSDRVLVQKPVDLDAGVLF